MASATQNRSEQFDPVTGDIFMMAFNARRSGLDGRIYTDRSYFECVFEALDHDDRLVIAKMVAGYSLAERPYVFNRDEVTFYRCSPLRLAILNGSHSADARLSSTTN